MILRLRQLCCHPNLILVSSIQHLSKELILTPFWKSRADEFENPTALMGDDSDKELARALKIMGAAWVAEVRRYSCEIFVPILTLALSERSKRGGD